ncbi:agmatinase family protein [Peribacillus sp. SCS-155]|uniref:agmatinase family protein n=1 Tax=Peribacillus sedimenti TaxID=3115297 RepID=UPI003905771C
MGQYPYPQLNRPSFTWVKDNHGADLKVNEWIKTIQPNEIINWDLVDAVLLGVPLSRSSISASAASETPDAIRRAWKFFSTYNIDYDEDLAGLTVIDLGDVKQHITDITRCHENIKEAMASMRTTHPQVLPIALGGDHSITAMLLKGWKQVHKKERIGILQLDTHFDLRDMADNGPSNGTPIRNLIESDVVTGEDVYNIGLHGFFNAKSLKQYADRAGVNYITMRQARKNGFYACITEVLIKLSEKVDSIYVTVDMDVLDLSFGPGVPAATPGGMHREELFEAVYLAGKHPKVKAMDIVCIDPYKDISQITIKTAVHTLLSFLIGLKQRNR